MANERNEALDFLARLGRNPAVAFYESGVAATVLAILEELGVEHRFDEFGNIVARIPGGEALGDAVGHCGAHGPSWL